MEKKLNPTKEETPSKGTFGIPEVIAAFEERLAIIGWERDEAKRDAKKWRQNWAEAEAKYVNRPFKELNEYSSAQLLAEVERRLGWIPDGEDYDR